MGKAILLIGYNDITRPESWSGTPYNVINILKSRGVCVYTLDAYKWENCFLKFLKNIIDHIPLCRNHYFFIQQFLIRQHIKSYIKKCKLKSHISILFLGNGIDMKSKSIKTYLYCDAIHHLREAYYPYDKKRDKLSKWIKSYFIFKAEDSMFTSMTHIFTQSEWPRNYLIENLSLPSYKVSKVGFGLNINLLEKNKSYDNNLLLIILRKGNEKLKGLYLLLDAFKKVRQHIPNTELAVVGTQLQPQKGVTFYYNKPRSVTIELFQRATLYVMPALNEPNGQTYLEALANRTPIVGLNRFAFPEFCGNGQYGYICENEDADELADLLIQALSNKETLKEKANAGYAYVKNLPYDWNTIVNTFMQTIFN